jgi:hypothetical protein
MASWSYPEESALYREAQGNEGDFANLHVIRIAPGPGQVVFDWRHHLKQDKRKAAYRVRYRLRGAADEPFKDVLLGAAVSLTEASGIVTGSAAIVGLENGADYEFFIAAVDAATYEPIETSPVRLVRPGEVPGTVINYIHPEDYTYGFSGRSPASPSIEKLPDGRLVASHDVYWGKAGQNLTKIFRSADEGKTWQFIADLYPCFWGKLFMHRGSLYMLAISTEYGELLIGRSEDGGETWTKPTKLMEGGSREAGGPHKAPMPVIEHNGRLWTAIDHGSWSIGGHGSGVVSAPADADLLDAASWEATPFLPYDPQWPGAIVGGKSPGLLEGNVVVTPSNGLVNLLRYQTVGGTPDRGRAVYLHIDPERPDAALTFGKVIAFHGNMSKFSIYYDKPSGKYWSLVNRVTSDNAAQRNILTLVSSPDLEQWDIVKDVLDYEHNGWPEDNKKVGFQYVDWIFDGDDILYASRTAINGAHNYHNANYLTFHRIERFRE